MPWPAATPRTLSRTGQSSLGGLGLAGCANLGHAHGVHRDIHRCGDADWLVLCRARACGLACCQCHHCSPQWRMGCQHAEIAVAVRARWWHQGRNAINQLQWREGDLIHLGAALGVWLRGVMAWQEPSAGS
jgi:hypothetical protein